MSRKCTNESIGYAACVRVAEPLNIPRVGARVLPGGKLVRQSVCVDFAGTIRGHGRSLVVELKRTGEKTWFRADEPKLLKPHQRQELINQGRANAIAGVLIEATFHDRQYWCEWPLLKSGDKVAFADMLDLGPANVVADLSRVIQPAASAAKEQT